MPRWFLSFAFVDAFAAELLNELVASFPPTPPSDKIKTAIKKRQRAESALGFMLERVRQFRLQEKPNFLQRSRLAKRLQDGLLERGYPLELAQEIAVAAIHAGA